MTYGKIYMMLKSGFKFGDFMNNCRFPMFWSNLHADNKYIYWRHFGSSANECTKRNTQWIIETIFGMSADEFTKAFKAVSRTWKFENTVVFEVFNCTDNTWEYYFRKSDTDPIEFSFGVLESDRFSTENITNLYFSNYFA